MKLRFINLPWKGTAPLSACKDRFFREDSAPRLGREFSSREQLSRTNYSSELKFRNSVGKKEKDVYSN